MFDEAAQDIQEENLYGEGDTGVSIEPFDPKDVDIVSQTMVISNIIDRLKYDEIILDPDFQRLPNLWDDVKQSRLIESLIIRIPLPTFYFDSDKDDKLVVIDGLQRLTAIKRFAVLKKSDPDKLKLTGLEYLQEFDGCFYEDLPPRIKRRINEQSIITYLIRSGTPEKVRTSIFTRINTGGLTLTPAEIKNSVYRGRAAGLLRKLAATDVFKKATRNKIDSSRMLDCEFVNRFLAFYILGIKNYRGNLEDYLNDVLIYIQKASDGELEECEEGFARAMGYAYDIFGNMAFRKINRNHKFGQINKPLFDAVSVSLARLNEKECRTLVDKKDKLISEYQKIIAEPEFVQIISNGTARIVNVKKRHDTMYNLFRGIIEND